MPSRDESLIDRQGKATSQVRVVLLGGLAQDVGLREIEVEASDWREALLLVRERFEQLRNAIDERGQPRPGYLIFVDGVDARLAIQRTAKEVVILPVNHGGVDTLRLGWDDVEKLSIEVGEKIKRDGEKIDVIIGILRGGVIPARIISDIIGVDELDVVEIKFYTGIEKRMGKPYVRKPPISALRDRSVLIVDDISDTGLTLQVAVDMISLYAPRSIKTATLYIKPWTKFVPDYYAAVSDKWVIFPWEKWETARELGRA